MKKYLLIVLAACLSLCFCTSVLAQPNSTEEISYLFGDSAFAETPENEITAGDLVAVSARLHSTLNNGGLSEDYNFNAYNAYAVSKGIVGEGEYADENAVVTRAQTVSALYNAANEKVDLEEINLVLDMVDSQPDADYYEAALTFMGAGIIYGYDEYGSFRPQNSVKRYELGLMVDRLLNPSERVTKDYVVYSSDEPFYLIDDFLHDYGARGWKTGGSGWRIDYTGSREVGTINNYANVLRDFATDDNMSTSRRIHTQTDGVLVFEAIYKFEFGNTVGFAFYDTDGNVIADAGWKNGYAYIGNKSSTVALKNVKQPTKTPDVDNFNYNMAGKVKTRIIIDLDKGTYELWMGKYKVGSQTLKGENLEKVKIYTGIDEVVCVEINNTHLYKNFKVNDVFRLENEGEAPIGYTKSGNVTVERFKASADNTGEVNSVKMVTTAGSTTSAKRSFDKANGLVIAEIIVLLDDGTTASTIDNSAYFTLKCADVPVLTIKNDSNAWYADKTLIKDGFISNVWQLIRIEADTNTQKAIVKINGKVVAENVPFLVKAAYFDSLEFGVNAETADTVWFDDVKVHETFEYDDYCPEPVPLDTGDFILNMSVCNLWRNGSHYGWDWIRPFSELEPSIGYYDEGIPEEMDWEIKYLTEHGIKNYMTCWYPISGGVPLKKPRMSDALNDGYFNAKYSDMMTFSLMFENSGYISDAQRADFMNNVFPYWMEWYFSDDRYCRIEEDGKEYIFLTIYQYLYFLDMCSDLELLEYNENGDLYLKSEYKPSGSTPNSTVLAEAQNDVLNMLKWMEDQIVDAGYADGLIVVYGGSTQSDAAYKTMAAMGGDGIILYAWGKTAWDVETQKNLATTHMSSAKTNGIDMLTLATPGFNDIGWTTLRPGYMPTDEFETMLRWHKTRMGDSDLFDQNSWKSKFITFDTWNEYGEGHYFFPTVAHDDRLGYGGFGYLDVIAEVFGNVERGSAAAEANNTYPTAIQKARIGRLFPGDMDHYIRREMIVAPDVSNAFVNIGGYESFSSTSPVTAKYSYKGTECTNTSWWHTSILNHSSGCTYTTYTYPTYNSSKKALYLKSSPSCSTSSPMRIDFEGPEVKGVNMDDVSYIRFKMGTGTGGSTGKIYFKNTTDTSAYDGYAEERIFRFNTYVDGSDSCEYLINVKEHRLWTGTLAGIMFECTNEPDEDVYIYSLEFIKEDETTKKPQIYVDGTKYECKDYGEIRDYNRNEIYITPTEEGGLYKLLHIVYDWNRSTNKLKLDTPSGTTFEFTVGSKTAKVDGNDVALEKAVELYDGAPVIPLLFVLNRSGHFYSYNFTDKVVDVTVAQTFRIVEDIVNGNAEGELMTFTGYNNAEKEYISIVADPQNSYNKVWKRSTADDTKRWNYFSAPVDFVAGKTYTLDFDVYLDSVGTNGTTPSAAASIAVNPRYNEGSGILNHQTNVGKLAPKTWTHYTHTFTVSDNYVSGSGQMSIYLDPVDEMGCEFLVDNFILRCEPKPFTVINGDAEDTSDVTTDTVGFYSGAKTNPLTIETEADGNHYWLLTSKMTSQSWSYIIQNTTFEKGVTYYYKLRAKLGTSSDGASATNWRITLNARYFDAIKYEQYKEGTITGEWFAHTQDLTDKLGRTAYFNSGGDWQECYGSFTISQGYEPNGGPARTAEQITFFVNPVNTSSGMTFMIDDFEISTDPDAFTE